MGSRHVRNALASVILMIYVLQFPNSFKGTVHAGQPQGTIESLHGLDTYVIGNRTDPRAIIVIYSDVFSHTLPNNKLIADSYAKSGEYLVYMPDFFEGLSFAKAFLDQVLTSER